MTQNNSTIPKEENDSGIDGAYMPLTPVYGRDICSGSLNLSKAELPENSMPADSVYQIIKNELLMDAKPGLNLATFCNEAYTDPWGAKIVEDSIKKNFIDHTEYPGTNLTEKRSIRMIARELGTNFGKNSPPKNYMEEADQDFYGCATIGSSEAVMLGLIAHKFIWNMKHRVLLDIGEKIGIKVDPRDRPVVLMSSQVHGCWDKFCKYYSAVPLYVEIEDPPYAIHDALPIREILDTKIEDRQSRYAKYAKKIREAMGYAEPQTGRTIGELVMCVGAVVGTTFTGNYDNVPDIDGAVDRYCIEYNNRFTHQQQDEFKRVYRQVYTQQYPGQVPTRIPDLMDIPIHVDAASTGFVLMFSENGSKVKFNFKDCPKRVLSINLSNHKFGMTFTGMGTVVFKNSSVVDQSLIYHIAYLGGSFDDYTVNFSRGSSMIVMQYYNLLRFGRSGYTKIMDNCVNNTKWFVEEISKSPVLKEYLKNISNINIDSNRGMDDEIYLPIIALTWTAPEKKPPWDLTDLSDKLAQSGWVVPAYKIPVHSPEDTDGIQVLRIVVQQVVTRDKLNTLLRSMEIAVKYLNEQKITKSEKHTHPTSTRHTSCLC